MIARLVATASLLAATLLPTAAPLGAQERGAAALAQAVDGLGVTMRVLMIGAHPDDEDTQLIAGLARGQRVETAYLSLTRGDGGQNLIGNELGEALGAIRTEELLAARRVDGGRQYFTRAYDFGFSKSAEETYRHWPKDTLLGDVVRVVRAFRPHVIVAVFSGTPRDGHGHHQVSGLLAREAYDVAGDTALFPLGFGAPWAPLKFYRVRRGNPEGASVGLDVGVYDPVLGRSPAEIAGESRSQHKSQGFGALERKGPVHTYVLREASRVGPNSGTTEGSLFDGIDTTFARFAQGATDTPAVRAQLDSVATYVRAAHETLDLRRPDAIMEPLGRLRFHVGHLCTIALLCDRPIVDAYPSIDPRRSSAVHADFALTAGVLGRRLRETVPIAAGVQVEAFVPREQFVVGQPVPVEVTVYNHGPYPVYVAPWVEGPGVRGATGPGGDSTRGPIPPGERRQTTLAVAFDSVTSPGWLAADRIGDLYTSTAPLATPMVRAAVIPSLPGHQPMDATTPEGELAVPIVYRYADPVRGEVHRPLAVAPAVSVTLDRAIELLPANADVRRTVRVSLRSADTASRAVTVRLRLPAGLAADSATRTVTLGGHGAAADVAFTVTGRMAPGRDSIRVTAESGGETFASGYQLVDYPHVRPMRLYRPSALALQAVDVRVPAGLTVAYVPGVSDNVAPALRELGVDVTVVEPAALAGTDLSRFATVVIGPRAYEAHPAVMAARARLLDFARAGGTLVVQYQQYEIQEPGVLPYPVRVNRPHDRVTIEEAPVAIVDAAAPVLRAPNAIGAADFEGWVQERSLYMPREMDDRYRAPLEMHDPGEPPNRGALLVTPLGEGTVVYTTLSLFRQLPAGVPGAARLFVNLLAAGRPPVLP